MNILNNFTIRNLKLNKKRTIVTIIGILLSTALICAVAGVACSFQGTLISNAINKDGDYHASFLDVSKENQKYIKQNINVKSYFETQSIGYASIKTENKYKPYLHLMGFDKTAMNNYGLQLIEGRFPQNSDEILIPAHLATNGEVKLKVGEKITLDISNRMLDGYKLTQENPYNEEEKEELEKIFTKEYTIVGKIERPNYEIEEYSAPGYTIITLEDFLNPISDNNLNISVKFNNIKNTYDNVEEIKKANNISAETVQLNTELLRWSGVTRSSDTLTMLYSLAGIVILIIIVSSVFVIRSSFQISITEKMKQYGMLASIGATKKQIRKNVLFEGLILGTIGIPLGILSGCFATFVLTNVTIYIMQSTEMIDKTFEIIYNVPIWAILVSAILSTITIYASCIGSARKASKISPIEAIRSNDDIKIKSKKLKTPKIVSKIFGIGGEIAYKNLKRNRRKYRTTVVSLVVSITIFISLSTFIQYVFDVSNIYYKDIDYNVAIYANDNKSFISQIEKLDNIEKIAVTYRMPFKIDMSKHLTEEGKKYYEETYKTYYEKDNYTYEEFENDVVNYINFVAVSDTAYKEYIQKLGISEEDAKNSIIYIGAGMLTTYDSEGNPKKIKCFNIKEGDTLEGKFIEDESTKGGVTTQKLDDQISNLKIIKVTDEKPFGLSARNEMYLVNFDTIKNKNYNVDNILVQSNNPEQFCKELENISDDMVFSNLEKEQNANRQIVLLISIFLYGFIIVISLIGVTNIFNTITTNMNLRSKEFANLKSIGMTKKEFNKMINLESILYGTKALLYGIILGTGLSYWIYTIIEKNETLEVAYILPVKAIVISIVFVMFIVGLIMRYSLNKINKQNIIETIRNDNI